MSIANFNVNWWNKLGNIFTFIRNCFLVFRFFDDGEIKKTTLCPLKNVPVFVHCITGVSCQSFMILDSQWVFWRKLDWFVMVSHDIHVSWMCQTCTGVWIPLKSINSYKIFFMVDTQVFFLTLYPILSAIMCCYDLNINYKIYSVLLLILSK